MKSISQHASLFVAYGACAFAALALGCSSAGPRDEATAASSSAVVIEPTAVSSPQAATALAATHKAASENASSDLSLNLLVRLYLDDGNMLQFYEPTPGTLVFAGLWVGGTPLDVRVPGYNNMSAVDLFQALEPNMAIPSVLVAAQQRYDARGKIAIDGGVDTTAMAVASPGGPPNSQPIASTGPTVKPLDCGGCANWCDFSCWQCRECSSGDWYDWCFQDAYAGASADNNAGSFYGQGDFCSDQGSGDLGISSSKFSGNFHFDVQTDAFAWSKDGDTCFFDDAFGGACDEGITFTVSGSNIHGHFGGEFIDF